METGRISIGDIEINYWLSGPAGAPFANRLRHVVGRRGMIPPLQVESGAFRADRHQPCPEQPTATVLPVLPRASLTSYVISGRFLFVIRIMPRPGGRPHA